MTKKKTHTVTWNKQPLEQIRRGPLKRRLEVWWCGIWNSHYATKYDYCRFCPLCGFKRPQENSTCPCGQTVTSKYCRYCGRPAPLTPTDDKA